MIATAEEMRKLPCIGPVQGNCTAPKCNACERYPGTKKYPTVRYYCGLSQSREIRVHPEPEDEPLTVLDITGTK